MWSFCVCLIDRRLESYIFRFQSVYVCERAPHAPRGTGAMRGRGIGEDGIDGTDTSAGGGGRALTHPTCSQDKKSTSISFSLMLHSNAEIRTHQTCHLLMLTRVTESPIVEAPHERADHDAVACLALPAIAHAEDASVVGATSLHRRLLPPRALARC